LGKGFHVWWAAGLLLCSSEKKWPVSNPTRPLPDNAVRVGYGAKPEATDLEMSFG